jgi:hypothetical protein
MSNNINNNRRVMPVPQGRGAQGQMHQHRQQQQQRVPANSGGDGFGTGNFDRSSFEAPQTSVPVRGIGVDVVGGVPVDANSYLIAEWETTSARVGENVRIRAKLNRGIDGVARVQVFHEHRGQQVWVESINGFINKGVVTANWIAKDNITDYDKGFYFFTIIGGRANAQSTNQLKLRGK